MHMARAMLRFARAQAKYLRGIESLNGVASSWSVIVRTFEQAGIQNVRHERPSAGAARSVLKQRPRR
jgi:hypothetical protein